MERNRKKKCFSNKIPFDPLSHLLHFRQKADKYILSLRQKKKLRSPHNKFLIFTSIDEKDEKERISIWNMRTKWKINFKRNKKTKTFFSQLIVFISLFFFQLHAQRWLELKWMRWRESEKANLFRFFFLRLLIFMFKSNKKSFGKISFLTCFWPLSRRKS